MPSAPPSLSYDANGTLASDGQRSYSYDQEGEGRILAASLPGGGSATYRYDPFGRRTSKTVNGTTTVWLRDEQGHAVAEYDGASGALVHYPLHDTGTAPVARIGAERPAFDTTVATLSCITPMLLALS